MKEDAIYVPPNPLYDTVKEASRGLIFNDQGFVNVLSGDFFRVDDPYVHNNDCELRMRTTYGKRARAGTIDCFDVLYAENLMELPLPSTKTVPIEQAAATIARHPGWGPMDQRTMYAAFCAADTEVGRAQQFKALDGNYYETVIVPTKMPSGGIFRPAKHGYRVFVQPCSANTIVPEGFSFGLGGPSNVHEREDVALGILACIAAFVAENPRAARDHVLSHQGRGTKAMPYR